MTPQILSAVLKHLKSRPTFESVGIKSYRKILEKSALAFKPDRSVKIEPCRIKGIHAQWLTPLSPHEKRIILYVHGGGYIAGSMASHRDLASRIAAACATKVLIFNYRLAPEHPFPEGLTDVKEVYHWLADHFLGRHQICLVADSAGAGLALALLSLLLKQKHPLPVCTALISPWIDLECRNPSHVTNQDKDPMLSQDLLRTTARLYTDKDLSDPLISPVNSDLKGISPILIQVGSNEVLLDDSRILADRLKKTGAVVQLEIWEEMFHVWHYFARYLYQGRNAILQINDFINRHA